MQWMAPDTPLGPAAPLLYAMAAERPSCFFDVTAGDNRCPFGERWKVSDSLHLSTTLIPTVHVSALMTLAD